MTPVDLEALMRSLHPQCIARGCCLPESQRLLAAAERLAGRTKEGRIVSQALWCDQGDHPFSARDPKAEHWERQGTDPKTSEKITIPWDVCGAHMDAINGRLAAMEREITGGGPASPGG